jgi:hypothetical protein
MSDASGKMKSAELTDAELDAFLDEELESAEMARLEQRLRDDTSLARRLAEILRRRDAGVHTLGSIWRRHRVGCPSREHLGAYLLGSLDEDHARHIRFHLESIACRLCQANLTDLQARQKESRDQQSTRQRKYFQSSAGYLKPHDSES